MTTRRRAIKYTRRINRKVGGGLRMGGRREMTRKTSRMTVTNWKLTLTISCSRVLSSIAAERPPPPSTGRCKVFGAGGGEGQGWARKNAAASSNTA